MTLMTFSHSNNVHLLVIIAIVLIEKLNYTLVSSHICGHLKDSHTQIARYADLQNQKLQLKTLKTCNYSSIVCSALGQFVCIQTTIVVTTLMRGALRLGGVSFRVISIIFINSVGEVAIM